MYSTPAQAKTRAMVNSIMGGKVHFTRKDYNVFMKRMKRDSPQVKRKVANKQYNSWKTAVNRFIADDERNTKHTQAVEGMRTGRGLNYKRTDWNTYRKGTKKRHPGWTQKRIAKSYQAWKRAVDKDMGPSEKKTKRSQALKGMKSGRGLKYMRTDWNTYRKGARKYHPRWTQKRMAKSYGVWKRAVDRDMRPSEKKTKRVQAIKGMKSGRGLMYSRTDWNTYKKGAKKRNPGWTQKRISQSYQAWKRAVDQDMVPFERNSKGSMYDEIRGDVGPAEEIISPEQFEELLALEGSGGNDRHRAIAMLRQHYTADKGYRPRNMPVLSGKMGRGYVTGGYSCGGGKKRKPNVWMKFLAVVRKYRPGINMKTASRIYQRWKASR